MANKSRRSGFSAARVLSAILVAAVVLIVWAYTQKPGSTQEGVEDGVQQVGGFIESFAGGVETAPGTQADTRIGAEADKQAGTQTGTDEAGAKLGTPGAGVASSTALEALGTLAVHPRASWAGYNRVAYFGEAWIDVDNNGCNTRDDILARDFVSLQKQGACKVVSGTLADPYTGQSISFVRGKYTSEAVQIDHVVALQDAWRTGAKDWPQSKRIALANDPLNLLAVDGPANQDKMADNASEWLPYNTAYHCEYVARQVSVKYAYGLWVTPDEKQVMSRILKTCPDQLRYLSSLQ